MRNNLLILFAVLSFILISCEQPKDEWINQYDSKADAGDIAKICKQSEVECGKKWINYNGADLEINCGGCSDGYECRFNDCWDIDECADPDLNNCPEHSTCVNKEGTYSCVCDDNYSGDDCVPDTRTKECENLPEKAEWNTVPKIKQTWNGSDWEPSNNGTYNEESSETECRFKCLENYNWNDEACEPATRTAKCTGLPKNAEWNTVSEITQTWDGEAWQPSEKEEYNEKASTSSCRFKCKKNYNWNETDSKCEPATRESECKSLAKNAVWNTASSITQTWNGEEWVPTTTGSYNEEASTEECRYICAENYSWKNAKCVADTRRVAECAAKPDHAEWNDSGAEGKFTQTWDGSQWSPTSHTSSHNIEAGECRFICDANYYWDESECVNPCDYEPCAEIPNSPRTCTASAWNDYTCACDNGYFWNGETCRKQIPLGNICTGQTSCYDNESNISCPMSGKDFYGQDAQYAKLGYCYPQSFLIKTNASGQNTVIDNNTGLEWQQVISEKTFSWENAIKHCKGLNYGGHKDWRLPSPQELLTIANSNRHDPPLDSTYFKISLDLWTSKPHSQDAQIAFSFGASYGYVWWYKNKSTALQAMCVRGNELPEPVFSSSKISGDTIISDSTTGLIWQQTYETSKTWQEALKYCEDLTYARKNDWRLPNKNELASLLNYDKSSSPYSDFPNMPPKWFWGSTTSNESDKISIAWHTNFGNTDKIYGTNTESKSNSTSISSNAVRCVRSERINDPCENHICGSVAHSSGVCVPENAFEYSCACDEGYFWDGEECVNPCNANPCNSLSNSTKVCTSLSPTDYSCGCNSGYGWNGEACVTPLTLGNICTGQTKCFNNEEEITCPTSASANFYGQDAQYRNKCTAQSFKEITAFGQKIVIDKNTTLQWQQTMSGASYNWEDAIDYCEDLEYGGYTDWRLPSPHELLTITDISRDNPAVNTTYFKISSELWSSASYSDTNAFFLGKGAGVYYTKEKTESIQAMCVRGNELKEPTFTSSTTNSEVVIKDSATNLNWQKTYATKASWLEALKYCENLTYAGKSDWRMPNKNELASLVNYEKTNPASDFPDITTKWFWTSSTHINNLANTWNVAFANGSVGINASKNSSGNVRCVR